ncbi:MAG: tetratricopeptide repeat protein, partial [Chrysiogenales bacterium]
AMYYHALSLIELGRKEDAETLLRDYIGRGDKSRRYFEARCELGRLLVEGERSEEGLRILEGVRTGSSKKSIRSRAMKLLGAYYIEKNPPKALVYLEESLIAAPKEERRDLLLSLGKAYFRTGLYERAAVTFSLHAKENPFDAAHGEVRFLLARAYLEGGDFTRASDLFEAIGRDDPFSPFSHESRYYLALTRSRRGDAAGAVPLLNDYLRGKNIENAYDANLLLLRIQLGLDDLEGAGKTAETLIRHFLEKAGVEAAIFEYAAALIGKGRNSKRYASILFSRFSGSEPAADLNVLLGNDYFDQGRYVPALEHYNMYLDTPHLKYRGTVFYRKLLALYRLERDEELTAIIARGEYPPMNGKESAEVPLLLARSYSRLKMYDKAYMAIDASRLAHYPADDVLSYVNSSLRVGDVPSAIRASVFLEGKGEMHAQSLYMIGDYFMKRGKREKSEHYFTMVAAEYPGTAYGSHAKLSLGEVRLLLGEWQRAVNLIEGVEASPGSDLFNRKKSLIIQCYFKMGKEKEALALVQSAQRDLVAGEYGEPVMKLAMEYHYRKKDLQQFTRYASLLAGYPGNGDLINYLSGKLYAQAGNHSKAYLYFKELAGVGGRYRDESFYYLGLHEMLVNGNTEKALTYFSGILEMPDAGKSLKLKALLNMALIYRDEKEDGKARDCLIRVKSATHRGLVHIQALNLLDAFGYQAP